MNFDLTEEQELLQRSVRELLERECPISVVRMAGEGDRGYAPDVWRQLVQADFAGMIVPERYGGAGRSLVDLVLLAEEIGRAAAPVPFASSAIAAQILVEAGSDAQKDEWLPRLAGGSVISLAWTEPGAGFESTDVLTTARLAGDGYVIDGRKLFVADSEIAEAFLVVARTGTGLEDLSLLLVDAAAPDIHIVRFPTLVRDSLAEVVLNSLQTPASARVGLESQSWPTLQRALRTARLILAAETIGLASQAQDLALEYAKSRIQFGVPIGSFQVLQHRFSDRAVEIDGARLITHEAAWLADQSDDAIVPSNKAKSFSAEMARRAAIDFTHMFGGYGTVDDTAISLYYRRLRANEVRLGAPEDLIDSIAGGLGLIKTP